MRARRAAKKSVGIAIRKVELVNRDPWHAGRIEKAEIGAARVGGEIQQQVLGRKGGAQLLGGPAERVGGGRHRDHGKVHRERRRRPKRQQRPHQAAWE